MIQFLQLIMIAKNNASKNASNKDLIYMQV